MEPRVRAAAIMGGGGGGGGGKKKKKNYFSEDIYRNKPLITLVRVIWLDISLSRLYFHSPLENKLACS